MTKRKVIGQFLFVALLLCSVAVTFYSCSHEETDVKSVDKGTIQLTVKPFGDQQNTYSQGTASENKLDRLRIMIFNNSTGQIEVNQYHNIVAGGLPFNDNYTLIIGQKYIQLIGNEDVGQKTVLDGITTLNALKALTIADETTINATGALLPFSSSRIVGLTAGSTLNLNMPLERSLAKINVNIQTSSRVTKVVNITSIQIVDVPTSSTLINGFALPFPTLADLPVKTLTLAPISTTAISIPIDHPYIYEYYPTGAAIVTRLKVDLDIAGTPKTFYTPVICAKDATNSYIYGTRRNTISTMTLTYIGDYITVEYDSVPWNDENPYDRDPGKDESNFKVVVWDDGSIYDYAIPYT